MSEWSSSLLHKQWIFCSIATERQIKPLPCRKVTKLLYFYLFDHPSLLIILLVMFPFTFQPISSSCLLVYTLRCTSILGACLPAHSSPPTINHKGMSHFMSFSSFPALVEGVTSLDTWPVDPPSNSHDSSSTAPRKLVQNGLFTGGNTSQMVCSCIQWTY